MSQCEPSARSDCAVWGCDVEGCDPDVCVSGFGAYVYGFYACRFGEVWACSLSVCLCVLWDCSSRIRACYPSSWGRSTREPDTGDQINASVYVVSVRHESSEARLPILIASLQHSTTLMINASDPHTLISRKPQPCCLLASSRSTRDAPCLGHSCNKLSASTAADVRFYRVKHVHFTIIIIFRNIIHIPTLLFIIWFGLLLCNVGKEKFFSRGGR